MSKQEQYTSNLFYFEALSMRELYDSMKSWQEKNRLQFLSLAIQRDGAVFSCIACVNPENFEQTVTKTDYEEAMARFERKALRVIVKEKNTGAIVEFVHPIVPGEKILAIQKRLKDCTTAAEIRTVFQEEH